MSDVSCASSRRDYTGPGFERFILRLRVGSPAHFRDRRRRLRPRPVAQGQRHHADARRLLCAAAVLCVSPADHDGRNRTAVRTDGAARRARHARDGGGRRPAVAGAAPEPHRSERVSPCGHVLERRELRAAGRVVRVRGRGAVVRDRVFPDRIGVDQHRRRLPRRRRPPEPAQCPGKRVEDTRDLRHRRGDVRARNRHRDADAAAAADHDAERRGASADDPRPWHAARARGGTETTRRSSPPPSACRCSSPRSSRSASRRCSNVSGAARQAVVVLSSMPVAVATTILALEFDASPDFVTSAVFLSTILSPITLTPLIAYLR